MTTRHYLTESDLPEYEAYLRTEQAAGRVVGWGTVASCDGRGVYVITRWVG